MPKKHSFDFVKHMTQYGILLGCLVGFVGTIPMALMWFDLSILLPVLALIVIITMFGGLIGAVYGAISGFISGILMSLTTRFIFREIKQSTSYKMMMGLLALGATFAVFLVDQLWIGTSEGEVFAKSISSLDLYSMWFMSLVFAVYASQRAITQYFRDFGV